MLVVSALCASAPLASAETRTLKLYYTHTREKAEITFKKNGKYLPSGLKQLNHFLRDWRRNEPTKMDPRLFDLVWETYRTAGGRDYIHVVSAYRSPATNSMLRKRSRGVAEKSQHMLGKAMDFFVPGVSLKTLRNAALRAQGGGVGYYPRSGSPFVHLDVGNVRHWPRMSRSELASVFPNGKTLHVPTDGKPLAGYDVALANYKSRRGKGVAVATEEETRKRSGGFLSAFFGGGADEEEESGGAVGREAPPAAMPKQPVAVASAPAPKPSAEVPLPGVDAAAPAQAVPVQSVADMIAGIQLGDLPSPLSSPRRGQSEFAVASAEAEEMDVPVPLPRPGTAIALASRPPASAGERALESLLAGEDGATAGIPVPAARPVIAASLGVDSSDGKTAKSGRLLASARPGVPLDAVDPVAALQRGPATTPKAAKPSIADTRPEPRPVRRPVQGTQAQRALTADASIPLSDKPDGRAFALSTLRAAPDMVYTDGFRADAGSPNSQRFSGKAVTFLSVAKFRTN